MCGFLFSIGIIAQGIHTIYMHTDAARLHLWLPNKSVEDGMCRELVFCRCLWGPKVNQFLVTKFSVKTKPH